MLKVFLKLVEEIINHLKINFSVGPSSNYNQQAGGDPPSQKWKKVFVDKHFNQVAHSSQYPGAVFCDAVESCQSCSNLTK